MNHPSRLFAHLSVILALALVAPIARAAYDAFLKIEGVPGESTDPHHTGWIEVESYQLDPIRNSAMSGGGSSGGGAGKVQVHDISFTKKQDKASAVLMKSCASGKHFPNATLSVRKAGGSQQEYLVIKLQDVVLSSYGTGRGGGGAAPAETFVLNAANATLENAAPRASSAARNLQAAPGAAGIVNLSPTITKVSPSAASATTGQALTFSVEGTGSCVRSRIDFGDGTVVEFPFANGKSQPAPTHTYSKGGTFEVRAYGLADPWAKLPAPPQASEHVCSGHASANVAIHLPLAPAVAPAVRKQEP